MTGVECGAAEGQVIHHLYHCDVGTEQLEKKYSGISLSFWTDKSGQTV